MLQHHIVLWHTHTAQDVLHHSLQLVDVALLVGMSPVAFYALTGDEERDVTFLAVALDRILGIPFLLII